MYINTDVAKPRSSLSSVIALRGLIVMLVVTVLLAHGSGPAGDHVFAATSTFAGGTGSSSSPYLIETAEQLNAIRTNLSSHFRLVADIDLSAYASGSGWQPIVGFAGTFDGQGYVIRNLTIQRPTEDTVGLFADPTNSVQRVRFVNASVIGRNHVGVVAGTAWGLVSKVHAQGTVVANDYAGGLVGSQFGNRISLSGVNVSVSSNGTTGGLVGQTNGAVGIDNCFAIGRVEGKLAGGLIGADNSSITGATIRNSYAAGPVSGRGSTYTANGFVGYVKLPQIAGCYFDLERAGRSDIRATAKSWSEMKQRATFSTWDLSSTWGIADGEGYPYLLWLRPGLESFEIDHGTLNPAFGPWTQIYTVDLPSTVNEITVMPRATDAVTTLRVNGQSLVSGSSLTLPIRAGTNTFVIAAEGEGGVFFIDYTLIVTRAARTDASLSSLVVAGEPIAGFDKGRTSYTMTLPYLASTAPIVSAISTDSAATALITQAAGVPGAATVTVTAEDGVTTATYTVSFEAGAGVGSGTAQSPYLVTTAEHLHAVRYYLDRHFRLAADLDLSSYEGEQGWLPIGTEQQPFTGSFDGGGHTISRLRIQRTEQSGVGLFGWTGGTAVIRNLHLSSANVVGNARVGILVGDNGGRVQNVATAGTVTATDIAGGLTGQNRGVIVNCYSTVIANGISNVGGLVGTQPSGSTTSSYYNSHSPNNGIGVGKSLDEMQTKAFAAALNRGTPMGNWVYLPNSTPMLGDSAHGQGMIKAEDYSISVQGGSSADLTGDRVYFDTPIIVVADAPADGMQFAYWTMNGIRVSYAPTYMFYASGDAALQAYYLPTTEEIVGLPLVRLEPTGTSTRTADGSYRLSYIGQTVVPAGYELVEYGLLLINQTASPGSMEIGRSVSSVEIVKLRASARLANGQYMIMIEGVPIGRTRTGRAYLVYRDAATKEEATIYSSNVVTLVTSE